MRFRSTVTRVVVAFGLMTGAAAGSLFSSAGAQAIEHAPTLFTCAGTVSWSQPFTDPDGDGFAVAPSRLIFGNSLLTGVAVPAGTYTVGAQAWDGYAGRNNTPDQPNEQYELQFLDGSGAVIATSGFTQDGIDTGVLDDEWIGGIGSISLPDGAANVRLQHSVGVIPGASGPNSVFPVGFCMTPTTVDPTPTPTSTPTPTPCPGGGTPGTDPSDPCPGPTPTPTSTPTPTPCPGGGTPGTDPSDPCPDPTPTPTPCPGGGTPGTDPSDPCPDPTPTPTSTPTPTPTPCPGGGTPGTDPNDPCPNPTDPPGGTPTPTPCPDGSDPGSDPDDPCPDPTPTPCPDGSDPGSDPDDPCPNPTDPPGGTNTPTPEPTDPGGTPPATPTPGGGPGGGLPQTGSDSGLLAQWGLGILSFGILLAGVSYHLSVRRSAERVS